MPINKKALANNESPNKHYNKFTPTMALNLAAPHTWPAAILPVAVAYALAKACGCAPSALMACVLLAICVLMQAAANTFNDYYDYKKGTDSATDDVDPTDAVLIYNNVNPNCALALAIGMLVAAFLLGGYVIYCAGFIPLLLGIVGAFFVIVYSAGKTPISYLPIGEAVSGIAMGGLIVLACFFVFAGRLDAAVLLWALPCIIGIGLIMLTNNTCDIEKDVSAKRRTFSVLVGRARARHTYHICVWVWLLAIVTNVAAFFTGGVVVLLFMALSAYPILKALLKNPLVANTRQVAMSQICSTNICLGAWYAAAIFAHGCL